MTVSAELAEIRLWWAARSEDRTPEHGPVTSRIAGSPHDQTTPDGIDNPYWQIIRQLPCVDSGTSGITPDGFARGLPVSHHLLTKRYSWAIPSPGDITWLTETLDHRGLVEIGAGSGYWAWQAQQAGIDAVAYEPDDPTDNTFIDGIEYVPLLGGDHTAAANHPDRAMLLCWPSHNQAWAAQAVNAYQGDLLIYIGEGQGGHCAANDFFDLLNHQWAQIDASPHHVAWWHTHCTMTAYHRVPHPYR